jgi:GTP cyclohydrolase II
MIHLYGSTWDNPGDIHFAASCDADLMLDNGLSPDVTKFQQLLDAEDKTPRTLLRFSSNGNTFYPYINGTNSTPTAEVMAHRLEKMGRVLGREIPVSEEDLRKVEAQKRKIIGRVDGFDVLEAHIAETPYGQFYLYGMVNPEDPWQYYELLTPQEIEKIDPSTKIFMRLDSGCDTGQCYHDEGCECRDQLHSAMEMAMEDNGLLLLAPSHNGRGYGLITKLLTEGAKQGIPMGYNDHYGRQLDTVEAAKALFGERYDIRTFEGTANILLALGITKVHLFTDNVPKTRYLQEAGIEVVRVPTDTKKKVRSKKLQRHLTAKHGEDLYFKN